MTTTDSKKPTEKKRETCKDNADARSEISVKSAKSAKSKRSVKSVKSVKSTKGDKAGGDSYGARSEGCRSCSFCSCPMCPARFITPPPILKRIIDCANINEVLPPIIPKDSPKKVPSAANINLKSKAFTRASSPAQSVKSEKSVKSINQNDNKQKQTEATNQLQNGGDTGFRPIELRASVLINYCDCVKKNGLQDNCPRYPCKKGQDYA